MAIEAVVNLDTLHCRVQRDRGGSEPYAWTVLTWVEPNGDRLDFGMYALPASVGARAVIKKGMKAGQQAPMPSVQRVLTHRFENGVGSVGVAVVLLEEDELDASEVRRGYNVFVREVENVIGSFVEANLRGPTPEEMARQNATIQRRVIRAIKGALSGWEKLGAIFGFVDPDDHIGSASYSTSFFGSADPQPFTLDLVTKITVQEPGPRPSNPPPDTSPPVERVLQSYTIDGRLELRTPVPVLPGIPSPAPSPPPPRPPAPPRPRPRPPGTHEP